MARSKVHVAEHRGFAIYEFIWILRRYEVDPDYCPDPDDGGRIPGNWVLIVNRLYRAVRIKNGAEIRARIFDRRMQTPDRREHR